MSACTHTRRSPQHLTNHEHGPVWSVRAGERRTTYSTQEEQEAIMTEYEELKHVINVKSNTVTAAKARKECWQKIADSLNA